MQERKRLPVMNTHLLVMNTHLLVMKSRLLAMKTRLLAGTVFGKIKCLICQALN